MALYTDNDIAALAQLVALDREIPDVAETNGIVIEGDASICRRAWQECLQTILAKQEAFGGIITATSPGAQWSYLPTNMGSARSRVFATQIVVDDQYANSQSLIRQWVALYAAYLFWDESVAHYEGGSDRYQRKADKFEARANRIWKMLCNRGLPIVATPLPCPGALHEPRVGSWGAANLSATVSAATTGAAYDVAITWVDGSKYISRANIGNAESGPSATASITVPDGKLLSVSLAGLTPPTGTLSPVSSPADGVLVTLQPTHCNIYVGASGGPLYLQNAAPVPLAAMPYTLSAAPVLSGELLRPGQVAYFNLGFSTNMIQRR